MVAVVLLMVVTVIKLVRTQLLTLVVVVVELRVHQHNRVVMEVVELLY